MLDLVNYARDVPASLVMDGAALFDAVCKLGLEGVVAKRLSSRYRPGERGWSRRRTRATGGATWSARRCRGRGSGDYTASSSSFA
jgi:hypothetical protein